MMDLLKLAERVEALDGPCRETDLKVFHAIGAPVPFQFANKVVALAFDETRNAYFAPVGDMQVRYEPPAYTASLDAAMTLVPEGWTWTLVDHCDGSVAGLVDDRVHPVRLDSVEVEAVTPALALTAAAIRALATTKEQS